MKGIDFDMKYVVHSKTTGIDSNGETKIFYFVYDKDNEDPVTKEQLALATFYSSRVFNLSGLYPSDFPFCGEIFINISKLNTSLTTFTSKKIEEAIGSMSDKEISIFVDDLTQSQKEILSLSPYALNSSDLQNYIGKKVMILRENFGWGSVSPYDIGVVRGSESIDFPTFKDWGIKKGSSNAFVPLSKVFEFITSQEIHILRRTIEVNESMILEGFQPLPEKLLVVKNTVKGVEDNG